VASALTAAFWWAIASFANFTVSPRMLICCGMFLQSIFGLLAASRVSWHATAHCASSLWARFIHLARSAISPSSISAARAPPMSFT
jgi:hypothetical protein